MNFLNDIQVFLLNLSFIFILYFVFYSYIEGKINNRFSHEIFIGLISTLALILCMTFPITPISGFIFDMRQVPFIIGALYGGRRVAFSLLIFLLSYRFFLGTDTGFYVSVYLYILLILALLYFISKFRKANTTKERVIVALVASICGNSLFAIIMFTAGVNISLNVILTLLVFYGTQTVGIVLFVTFIERVKKEQLMFKEVKKLEKLRVVSDLAASISHEVRNPLTVTKGFLQLLRETGIPDEKKNMYINMSIQELERAEKTISDYLTYARPSLENTEHLDLYKELDYISKVILPYATMYNVEVLLEVGKDRPFIVGERQKLHQCFINIIKNSIEAMPDGGYLKVIVEQKEGYISVLFKDTGIGMTKEQVNRIGTPYYSTKDKGTGLGMMVVISIVKVMGGQLTIDSEVGKGTCLALSFPLIDVD